MPDDTATQRLRKDDPPGNAEAEDIERLEWGKAWPFGRRLWEEDEMRGCKSRLDETGFAVRGESQRWKSHPLIDGWEALPQSSIMAFDESSLARIRGSKRRSFGGEAF